MFEYRRQKLQYNLKCHWSNWVHVKLMAYEMVTRFTTVRPMKMFKLVLKNWYSLVCHRNELWNYCCNLGFLLKQQFFVRLSEHKLTFFKYMFKRVLQLIKSNLLCFRRSKSLAWKTFQCSNFIQITESIYKYKGIQWATITRR